MLSCFSLVHTLQFISACFIEVPTEAVRVLGKLSLKYNFQVLLLVLILNKYFCKCTCFFRPFANFFKVNFSCYCSFTSIMHNFGCRQQVVHLTSCFGYSLLSAANLIIRQAKLQEHCLLLMHLSQKRLTLDKSAGKQKFYIII